jgi:hypothetical protein
MMAIHVGPACARVRPNNLNMHNGARAVTQHWPEEEINKCAQYAWQVWRLMIAGAVSTGGAAALIVKKFFRAKNCAYSEVLSDPKLPEG